MLCCLQIEMARSQTDADSVGAVLCQRATDLGAAALIMASHNKSALKAWFLGSASRYCAKHCTQPLVVLH